MKNDHTGSSFEKFMQEDVLNVYYHERLDLIGVTVAGNLVLDVTSDNEYQMVLTKEWVLIGEGQ